MSRKKFAGDKARGSHITSHFADFIVSSASFSRDSEEGELLWQMAAIASRAVSEGHICIHLSKVGGRKPAQVLSYLGARDCENLPDSDFVFPPKDVLIHFIESVSPCTSVFGGTESTVRVDLNLPLPVPMTPLVLDGEGRLYLQKYYLYERSLAKELLRRASNVLSLPLPAVVSEAMSIFRGLFPYKGSTFDWQDFASWLALRRGLLVISGGPGTGKTTTVSRILALAGYIHRTSGALENLTVSLCAPTGKAAARMGEAIDSVRGRIIDSLESTGDSLLNEVWENIPSSASTIHRLLGYVTGSPFFRRNHQSPLEADIVVVDEASMVPLPLMARLFESLKPGSRIILLGDMNQLASVQPGYVLGDMCSSARLTKFSVHIATAFKELSSKELPSSFVLSKDDDDEKSMLTDCTVMLTESYRFKPGGVIDVVSRAINSAASVEDSGKVIELIKGFSDDKNQNILTYEDISGDSGQKWLSDSMSSLIKEGFRPFIEASDAGSALAALTKFRIICGLRSGFQGVNSLNYISESLLFKKLSKILCAGKSGSNQGGNFYYDHRPVMVIENDYNLNLFNGDVGVALQNDKGAIEVWFEDDDGVRAFHPSALPQVETCFAQTVHKSQGSEFNSLLFVLPAADSPVLTKELVYTGLTRAMDRAFIAAPSSILEIAVRRSSHSGSGLADLLLKHSP
jgi:exodeoxyribonuclease V alpha subunit